MVQNAMCNSFVSMAKSSEKSRLRFLYDWCRHAKVVLALENTDDRKQISEAIKAEQLAGDPIMSKICLPAARLLPSIFEVAGIRGFDAIAFAAQAKRKLRLSKPMRCIGVGRHGHEGCPRWDIHHGHYQDMMLWIDMWKDSTELAHLEWPDCAEELTAAVCPQTCLISQFASLLSICQGMRSGPPWRRACRMRTPS